MPSDEEWRDALDQELERRRPELELYKEYYDGEHRLQFATSKFREAFGDLFEAFADNWCQLVVDIAVERLAVVGFRFGEEDADEEAWSIWQENNLDARQIAAHTDAVKLGTAYLLVGPPSSVAGEAVITVESAEQCITAHDPSDRRHRLAGLKKWRDEMGTLMCQLFLPDRMVTWKQQPEASLMQAYGIWLPMLGTQGNAGWEPVAREENPVGVVPLIPIENTPDLLTGGKSDLRPAVSLNDAANKFFSDMLVASEYIAFPQRVLTGVELPRDPVTGEILEDVQLRAAVSRMWAFEGENVGASSLPPGQLGQYVEGIDLAVQHLAAQTRTPPHYLLSRLVNLSGDALVAAETGLTRRCERKTIDWSDPWEETLRVAFKWRALAREGWAGSGRDLVRATMTDAETIWKDVENRDPITLTQSLTMLQAIGVPQVILWEKAGFSPQEIRRMKAMREEEEEKQKELTEQTGEVPPALGVSQNGPNLEVSGLPGPELPPAPPAGKAATNGGGK
jgi:hypothetical protein